MMTTELKEALALAWMQADKTYIALAKAGVAAHEAGNREAQHLLEEIAHEAISARRCLSHALNKMDRL